MRTRIRVVVVGAGAFGGWTALELRRGGADVTLVEAAAPGHARASSGGETRIIRATYGARAIYTGMATRAFELWRAYDDRWQAGLIHRTGGLWLFGANDAFGRASATALADAGLPFEWLTPAELAVRYPQIDTAGLSSALVEPEAGYLRARRSCEHVAERFQAEGGILRTAAVRSPVDLSPANGRRLALTDGSFIEADAFVFACGPWLGSLFPDVVGDLVVPTRQEVYYFAPPPGERRFDRSVFPVWVEVGDRVMYGVPGNPHHAFKVGDDGSGPSIDLERDPRELTPATIAAARAYLRRRFPSLADALLLGGEVCQYEASPDAHFVIDRHPQAPNVWLVGGGSGHGFKMGPVVGEIVSRAVQDDITPDPTFRLDAPSRRGSAGLPKWS